MYQYHGRPYEASAEVRKSGMMGQLFSQHREGLFVRSDVNYVCGCEAFDSLLYSVTRGYM